MRGLYRVIIHRHKDGSRTLQIGARRYRRPDLPVATTKFSGRLTEEVISPVIAEAEKTVDEMRRAQSHDITASLGDGG